MDCVDDQGAPFALHENGPDTVRSAINGASHGDVAYLTVHVADAGRARKFYGAVFGWTFRGGHHADGWQVDGPAPMTGLHGGNTRAMVEAMYRVDGIAAAVTRERAAGGTSTDPQRQPYGVTAHCNDDQGTPFHLGQL